MVSERGGWKKSSGIIFSHQRRKKEILRKFVKHQHFMELTVY